ncbi:MAG: hypothetical protein P8123_01840 [bacterium]
MSKSAVLVALAFLIVCASPSYAAIDKLQKEDAARFGVGMLNLYYNIAKSIVIFPKTVFLGLAKLPGAVATDIFQVGQKGEPSAYYMTERERREKEKQKKEERRLEEQEKQNRLHQQGMNPVEKEPLTKLKSW